MSSTTAILPQGWQDRLVLLKNENTGWAPGCALKDRVFNRAVIAAELVDKETLMTLVNQLPLSENEQKRILECIAFDIQECRRRSSPSRPAP